MVSSRGYDDLPFVAEFYDFVVPYRERGDVNFFVDAARECGGPVLEIGCGTGRVLIPTAKAGIAIHGLDSSPAMLAVCREKLARESAETQARASLTEGDMRQFDLGREFRLVTIPFRPFQHLMTVEEQLACLASVHRHLAPGGKLILDLFNPAFPHMVDEKFFEDLNREPPFSMPDGRKVLRRHHVLAKDFFKQTQEVELIHRVTYPDGREERLVQRFTMRYLFRFEAEHLLARSGFEVENVYADFEKSSYGSKYPGDLVFVARKK
jgi:SAM-dependent methyltransferase